MDHLDHLDQLDHMDHLDHLDNLDHIDRLDHLLQPSCSPVAHKYIPLQPIILDNIVKSVDLSSLSETA